VTGFELLENANVDVVIGSRMNRQNKMPTDRKILDHLANIFTFILYGTYTLDSQSGFRGFSRRAIEQIIIKTERMEVSSEIFGEISRLKLKWLEFPIKVRYTRYSRTKGQQNNNALPVIIRLILRLFR
jgi:hypothetical protein